MAKWGCCRTFGGTAAAAGEPLTFVFDFVAATSELDNLRCILDARHVPILKHDLSEEELEETYCLPCKLAFGKVRQRKVAAIDWFNSASNYADVVNRAADA